MHFDTKWTKPITIEEMGKVFPNPLKSSSRNYIYNILKDFYTTSKYTTFFSLSPDEVKMLAAQSGRESPGKGALQDFVFGLYAQHRSIKTTLLNKYLIARYLVNSDIITEACEACADVSNEELLEYLSQFSMETPALEPPVTRRTRELMFEAFTRGFIKVSFVSMDKMGPEDQAEVLLLPKSQDFIKYHTGRT